MQTHAPLTSQQAAARLGVTAATVKRWADRGILDVRRTAGGHRRFDSAEVDQLADRLSDTQTVDEIAEWVTLLCAGERYAIDAHLFSARSRARSWSDVVDGLGPVWTRLGDLWRRGQLSIAQEHAASESLRRALARISDSLPTGHTGNVCALACVGEEQHTLGLSAAELTVREAGWTPRFYGARTPLPALLELSASGAVQMIALSASSYSPSAVLDPAARALAEACRASGVHLILGGHGDWPDGVGVRLHRFVDLRHALTEAA